MRRFAVENDSLKFEPDEFRRAANMRHYLATLELTVLQP